MGADVNSNIGRFDGITSTEFRRVIGPHGLPQRNMKGESLLHVYLGHRLRVMNTYFETKSGSPVCSATLHKRARNCYTMLDGLDSDHCAVSFELNLFSIKYKAKSSLNRGDIDWRLICDDETQ